MSGDDVVKIILQPYAIIRILFLHSTLCSCGQEARQQKDFGKGEK